jgi:hypothetical protein
LLLSIKLAITIDAIPVNDIINGRAIDISQTSISPSDFDFVIGSYISFQAASPLNKALNPTCSTLYFFGNSKKPFTVLTWLCPKAIPVIGKSSSTEGTAGFLFYYLYTFPARLANQWRLKAGSQMVPCILYIVVYMKHTSNLERAIRFASMHLDPPLALDLKKVFWDVETGKYSTIKEVFGKVFA